MPATIPCYKSIDSLNISVPHIVYDCSLPIQERISKALHFPTAVAAALYIGMRPNKINNYTSQEAILQRKRFYSQKHGKQFAIRIEKVKKI